MENPVVTLLQKRHATRSISSESLAEPVIQELMEAVRLTPSCFNKQPWKYLFLESEQARAKGKQVLSEGNQPWASRAPLLIIGYSRKDDDCVMPNRAYHQFDLGMSAMNLMLAATANDLVARPMAGFSPKTARELFNLTEQDEPLVMIAVGRPADDESHLADHYKGLEKKPRERKGVAAIIQRV